MKCPKCGTENFDVAVTCARCSASLNKENPVFRSHPDPEPPTQISGVGMERVRFGPAPEAPKTPKPMRVRRTPPPQHTKNKEDHNQAQIVQSSVKEEIPARKDEHKSDEPSIVLFGVLACLLGMSFLFLCVDVYALYLLLHTQA